MSYCGECGAKLLEDAKFCPECGEIIKGGESNPQSTLESKVELETVHTVVKSTIQNTNVPMSKTKKIALILSTLIIILLSSTYYFLSEMSKPEATIEKFEKAIAEKDAKTFSELVESEDAELLLSEKNARIFLANISESPEYVQLLTEQLYNQVKTDDESTSVSHAVRLQKDGKMFWFFDKYKIMLKPLFIHVKTNYSNAKIIVNGEEIVEASTKNEEFLYGPLLPGQYEIEVIYESDLEKLTNSQTVSLLNPTETEFFVDLPLAGHYISLNSNYQDAKVLLNNKDTGLTVADVQSYGPVPQDGSLKIQLERQFPWGFVRSEEVLISESETYEIDLNPLTQQLQETIMGVVNTHNQEWTQAVKERNPAYLTQVTPKLYDNYQKNIRDYVSKKIIYVGRGIKRTIFDVSSIKITSTNPFLAEVKVNSIFTGDFVLQTDSPEHINKVANSAKEESNMLKYTLRFDDTSNRWLIDKRTEISLYSPNNKKVFDF